MFAKFLEHLGITRNPEQIQNSDSPDRNGASVAIEIATEAMEALTDLTLKAVSEIRDMVSSIIGPTIGEVVKRACEKLRFAIGWLSTTPGSNTISSEATG